MYLVFAKISIPGRHPKTNAKLEILMGSSIYYRSPFTPLELQSDVIQNGI